MDDVSAIPIDCKLLHPILSVCDLPASVKFYTEALGFRLGFSWGDPPRTVGVNLGEVSVHLRQGASTNAGAAVYFVVADVDSLHALHAKNGVRATSPPGDKAWGLREYQVSDPDGYILTFGQHVPSKEPKITVERVDVQVRLEKRLVALLTDLAAHKRMNVSECLEEVLLHSFERVGDGGSVASPHGAGTLAYIEELKKKHGVDYDTHDSYRFVEKP
jgi:catechol 2,3-dioxygenase-like lactoylglutathione lyase family enzyme